MLTNLIAALLLAGSPALTSGIAASTTAAHSSITSPVARAFPQSHGQTDQTIRVDVEERLTRSGLTEGNDLEVLVDDHIVFLEGSVQSLDQKRRVAGAAMGVDGVSGVMNHLGIIRRDVSDQEIADDIGSKIRTYAFYDIYDWIDGEVNDGVTTLTGRVRDSWRKRGYEARVEAISGVTQIQNEIEVLPYSSFDDDLRIAATRRIYNHPEFVQYTLQAHPPIHIVVENGRISLEGLVATELERRLAETALFGLDAFEIVNNLMTDTGS